MKVIFYYTVGDSLGKCFERDVIESVPEKEREIYGSLEKLRQRILQPVLDETIAVLLASNRKAFDDIYALRDLFKDFRVILILPDKDADTVALGHELYPRFLSYVDADFKQVADVLKKMMQTDK